MREVTMKKKISLLSLLSFSITALSVASCQPTGGVSSSISGETSESVDSAVDFDGTIHTQSGPADLNIYFYSDSASYEDRSWVYAWIDNGPSYRFQSSGDSAISLDGLPDNYKFIPVYIDFGQTYKTYSGWSGGDADQDFTASSLDDPALFSKIIFRSESGGSQTQDIIMDLSKVVDGNIYIFEGRGVYYSIDDFPSLPVNEPVYTEENNAGDPEHPAVSLTGSKMDQVVGDYSAKYVYLRPYRYDSDGNKVYAEKNIMFDAEQSTTGLDKTASRLILSEPLDLTYKYEFWCANPNKGGELTNVGDLNMLSFYSSNAFGLKYGTEKTLGATVNGTKTEFRLWAPAATEVTLNLYSSDQHGLNSAPAETHVMTKDANGVFEWTAESNLGGWYYTFDVTNYGVKTSGVADPYAYSSDTNGVHSMVVDWDQVSVPEGFDSDSKWAPQTTSYSATTIMEMQTRDFTMDESWNGSENNRGKFAGLHESGTKLTDGTATGFDYVKELHEKGLTHVQIMPAYDFKSVDETKLNDPDYVSAVANGVYNWGYDPQQYNAPEGSFSSNPDDGYARVNEMREFINAYNQAGIGVVMDVVYNHMPAQAGSTFEAVFPGYYFRSNSYSGAGSDIASQRYMVRKFIVDSVKGWAEHYHISGFRFDLMGILDMKTMEEVRTSLDEIDPDILVYGEGWTMFNGDSNSGLDSASDMAIQPNINNMSDDWVGAFNDKYRDGMKGSVFDGDGKGYVQKAFEKAEIDDSTLDSVYYGLTGTYYIGNVSDGFVYNNSSDDGIGASLAYVECHDNSTLWDKLVYSSGQTSRTDQGNSNDLQIEEVDYDAVKAEAKLANANVLGSLSPAFFQLGQSFGRSKSWTDTKFNNNDDGKYVKLTTTSDGKVTYYSTDSYNRCDEINAVDWNLLNSNSDLESDFEANLQARQDRSTALNRNLTQEDINNKDIFNLKLVDSREVISYSVKLSDGKTAYFIQNYGDVEVTVGDKTVAPHATLTFIQ